IIRRTTLPPPPAPSSRVPVPLTILPSSSRCLATVFFSLPLRRHRFSYCRCATAPRLVVRSFPACLAACSLSLISQTTGNPSPTTGNPSPSLVLAVSYIYMVPVTFESIRCT
ncbi:hypothetical protein PIB30_075370, partial [Stylosanthes scabra]|nr:hypothetical protein [Stylosanthes scabra]